ncbi:MAG: T9SS type A sorting domain-containing protein [Bacteroidota bacterium]
MKNIWKLSILILAMNTTKNSVEGQNLVPNNSFEIYDTCPNTEDQIQYAIGWSKYSQAGTTPDYYNACDTGGIMNVPNGGQIHQPAIDGNAYAALATFAPSAGIYREHIGIQLLQPLIVGQKYFLSFYTTMGEALGYATPSNNIGMFLSTVAYNQNNPSPINNFAHLYSVSIISDTVNWMHISGSIIADSAYNYCILGNFFDNPNTDTIRWNSNSIFSYYAVDVVCISTDSLTCNTTVGTYSPLYNEIPFSIYPNPSDGLFSIQTSKNLFYELLIYDELSQVIIQKVINERTAKIDLGRYADGIYLVKLKFKNQVYSKKILKF